MDPTLKQRLVGIAVLVGLAVIFVPMILDGPVEQSAAPASTGVPLALPAESAPVADDRRRSRPVVPEAVVVPDEPEPAEKAPGPDAGWAVQLGSFAASDNAEMLAGKIREDGFEAFVQRVQVANGTMYRVRVGPVADRDAATTLAARVQRASGEATVVVPHP